MKQALKTSILVMMLLCLGVTALADDTTVTVSGTAQVNAPTDRAVVHLGIRTRAETPSEAQQENSLRTDAVMKALTEDMGIAADKIATSEFSIYTYSEWVKDGTEEKILYQVMHGFSVTVEDIDKAGPVIDACVAAGANIVNYVSFESGSMKEAYDQALREAIADAKRKAELIAEAAGLKLGKLRSVTTVGGGGDIYNNSFRYEAEEDAAVGAMETKLAPGTQSTSATVTATWEME